MVSNLDLRLDFTTNDTNDNIQVSSLDLTPTNCSDLVAFIFGSMSALSRIIYTVIGLAGLIMIYIKAKAK